MCTLLLFVCYTDYSRRKIPNLLIAVIIGSGVIYRIVRQGGMGIVQYGESACIVFLLLYPLFKPGLLGAGDVKLFTAAAGWFLVKEAVMLMGISFCLAAAAALAKMLYYRNVMGRIGYLVRYVQDMLLHREERLYAGEEGEYDRKIHICMSGPILCGLLLHMGGVY